MARYRCSPKIPKNPRTTSTTTTTIMMPSVPIPGLLFFLSEKVIPHNRRNGLYQVGVFSATNRIFCNRLDMVGGAQDARRSPSSPAICSPFVLDAGEIAILAAFIAGILYGGPLSPLLIILLSIALGLALALDYATHYQHGQLRRTIPWGKARSFEFLISVRLMRATYQLNTVSL